MNIDLTDLSHYTLIGSPFNRSPLGVELTLLENNIVVTYKGEVVDEWRVVRNTRGHYSILTEDGKLHDSNLRYGQKDKLVEVMQQSIIYSDKYIEYCFIIDEIKQLKREEKERVISMKIDKLSQKVEAVGRHVESIYLLL